MGIESVEVLRYKKELTLIKYCHLQLNRQTFYNEDDKLGKKFQSKKEHFDFIDFENIFVDVNKCQWHHLS